MDAEHSEIIPQIVAMVFNVVMHDYLYYFDMIEYAVYHTERELMNYEALCKELQYEKNHQKRYSMQTLR